MRQKLIGAGDKGGHGCTEVRMIKENLMGAALCERKVVLDNAKERKA